ncbi:MAG: dipeptidase [Clostridia bacterium]|nr:dipeptidase [Clostridia bacterium]
MIFDLHCDTILRVHYNETQLRENPYHIDVHKMLKGPSKVELFAMYVNLEKNKEPFRVCNEMMDTYDLEISKNPELKKALSYNEILENAKANKMSAVLSIEEGGVIEGDLKKLQHFYDRGCRAITLTWNYENEIGFPNAIAPEKGLKPFGLEVIKKMNDLGIIIDVSHLSDAGFYDCINYSTKPIVATHSNARSVCSHMRNLTDDMILKLKENGGIMGMNFCSLFLDGSQVSKVSSIVEHIKYIYDLAGIEVIAIGTDFDGIGGEMEIANIGEMYKLKEALQEHFNDEQIEMIFYKNAERVFKAVVG